MKFSFKKFTFVTLGIILTPTLVSAAEINSILKGNTIKVGAVNASPWYQKDLKTNQWKGLVPDVVQAIFKGTNVKIQYVDTQWGTAPAGLQANRFDLLGGFNYTPERSRAVDFTVPMGTHKIGLLTIKKLPPNFSDWKNINNSAIKISVIDGSAAALSLVPKLKNVKWVVVPNNDVMQLELESGRVDALLSNDIQMTEYIKKRGRGQIIMPKPLELQATNIGIRKNRADLKKWLDNRLVTLKKEGVLDQIWAKYSVQVKK